MVMQGGVGRNVFVVVVIVIVVGKKEAEEMGNSSLLVSFRSLSLSWEAESSRFEEEELLGLVVLVVLVVVLMVEGLELKLYKR